MAARDAIRGGMCVGEALAEARQALLHADFSRVDYLALVDADTLEPVSELGGNVRVLAAATIGTTRLIDNLAV
jgi:pantoate--beta-alanine ligase